MADTQQQNDPGLIKAITNWLRSSKSEAQPAGQAAAEEVNKALPEAVSARSGLLKQRAKQKYAELAADPDAGPEALRAAAAELRK